MKYKDYTRVSGIDIYALGLNQDKWDARLKDYTRLIVLECVNAFHQTRTEITLEEYITNRLGITSYSCPKCGINTTSTFVCTINPCPNLLGE